MPVTSSPQSRRHTPARWTICLPSVSERISTSRRMSRVTGPLMHSVSSASGSLIESQGASPAFSPQKVENSRVHNSSSTRLVVNCSLSILTSFRIALAFISMDCSTTSSLACSLWSCSSSIDKLQFLHRSVQGEEYDVSSINIVSQRLTYSNF